MKQPAEIKTHLATIGDTVNQAMFNKRIGINELSQKSGINKLTIYKIFRGKNYNLSSLVAVCNALDLKISFTSINEKS